MTECGILLKYGMPYSGRNIRRILVGGIIPRNGILMVSWFRNISSVNPDLIMDNLYDVQ